MTELQRIEIGWYQIHGLCDRLADRLRTRLISAIIPISRGGLVPATILAYRLKVPVAGVILFVDNRKPLVMSPPLISKGNHDLLIVDDIADRGYTFRSVRPLFPKAIFAALFAKPAGLEACDEYMELVGQDKWVVFPWALDDEINR